MSIGKIRRPTGSIKSPSQGPKFIVIKLVFLDAKGNEIPDQPPRWAVFSDTYPRQYYGDFDTFAEAIAEAQILTDKYSVKPHP